MKEKQAPQKQKPLVPYLADPFDNRHIFSPSCDFSFFGSILQSAKLRTTALKAVGSFPSKDG
jgi:hypothetical protein